MNISKTNLKIMTLFAVAMEAEKIGDFTLDYLLIRGGKPDLSVCDSLEKGVIRLYNGD